MPTTIIIPPTGAPFGPGYDTQVVTTTIGPFFDPQWQIQFVPDDVNDGERIIWSTPVVDPHIPAQIPFPKGNFFGFSRPHLRSGTTGHVTANLFSNGVEVESSSVAVVSNFQDGAIAQLQAQISGPDGALTPIQAQQLLETHESTFPVVSMDALTLSEISSGPQGGVVSANLAGWIFGVIVRIASVPADYRVDTADGDYWVRSLAVVRIYRGSDLWKRVPVHTSSKLISFVDEGLVVAVASVTTLQWLLQISIQVSFAPGVTGQVFLMRTP